tara:strand:- start:1812 stop:2189 length:378 start_codon:yes stop_codon:yes gene_type:complete
MLLVTMTFPHINTSLQRGDSAYYVPISAIGNNNSITLFNKGIYDEITKFGVVFAIRRALNEVDIVWDNANTSLPVPSDDFILFSKRKEVNTSSLVGYFASVEFVNDSNERVELFSVGSEFSPSSK